MASIQQRGEWYHLHFRYAGRQYTHALKTKDRREAEAHRGTVDRLLIRIRNNEIPSPPEDADLPAFLLSAGKVSSDSTPVSKVLTLNDLRDRYLQTHGNGALEPKTLVMTKIHFRHLTRHFGERFSVAKLTPALLQDYVVARSEGKGKKKLGPISPVTIQKDIASLRAAWNWAVRCGLLTGNFPGRYLTYPKTDEKPGFQTLGEIERKIARGGLTETEVDDLWAGLFLTKVELSEFLDFAKSNAREPHLFPMLAFAAHTGARRSELIRMRVDDVDFEAGSAVIRNNEIPPPPEDADPTSADLRLLENRFAKLAQATPRRADDVLLEEGSGRATHTLEPDDGLRAVSAACSRIEVGRASRLARAASFLHQHLRRRERRSTSAAKLGRALVGCDAQALHAPDSEPGAADHLQCV